MNSEQEGECWLLSPAWNGFLLVTTQAKHVADACRDGNPNDKGLLIMRQSELAADKLAAKLTNATKHALKNRVLSALCAIAVGSCFATDLRGEGVQWLRSATEAANAAEKTGKPILVYVRSASCHYCDLMKRNIFDNPTASEQVMRDFIPLKLTREENAEAIKSLGVKGYPSTFVFSADRRYVGRIDGYVEPQEFAAAMNKARTATAPTKLVR